ncbi:proteasome-type protease [Aestuariivita sp.]|jgi:putative proteasome-type protease|uniref:proteasome-type protease n=1 Tax=Aestuariivita sp. TaxID=1872407 RepID=UPI0021729D88|nr:proteasome-type protease [Aestuariivita sp.]MCE8007652.1 proteasome-type protease [Aestuariivita sp.]
MTYCVGMRLKKGLVFMSDTRTNAGLDNIATAQKMHTWEVPGERVITLMTAGNLATTQAVVGLIDERLKAPLDRNPSILDAPSMFQIAREVGQTLKDVIADNLSGQQEASVTAAAFGATMIVGGQIKGSEPRLFLIYPEGNFIEASDDNPFFQIGETKYGKPILVRAYEPDMSFEDAVKLLLVSFDSTIKSNLSVGLPIDYVIYRADEMKIGHQARVEEGDAYYTTISNGWGEALKTAFGQLPEFTFG